MWLDSYENQHVNCWAKVMIFSLKSLALKKLCLLTIGSMMTSISKTTMKPETYHALQNKWQLGHKQSLSVSHSRKSEDWRWDMAQLVKAKAHTKRTRKSEVGNQTNSTWVTSYSQANASLWPRTNDQLILDKEEEEGCWQWNVKTEKKILILR